MSNHKIILAAAVFISLASGCSKEDDRGNAAPDPQVERTEKQAMAMEVGAARKVAGNGLTSQQESSTIAALMASGLTREQAEAMLAMGDGTPGSGEKAAAIAAMDARARAEKPKQGESSVTVRFDGVDYPMEFPEPVFCGDFFGITAADFSAIKSVSEGRVTKFLYNGSRDRFRFVFWRDTVPDRFDPVDSDAHFTIEKKVGVVSGFELINGMRGGDINADNVKSFVAEGSTLRYEGPFSAGSDKTITIDAVYCPK